MEVHLRRLGAEIELEADQPDQAALQIEIAHRICDELGLADVAPTIESLDALVKLSYGQVEEALASARRATSLLQRGTELPHLVWFRRHLVAKAAGEEADAVDSLARAVDAPDPCSRLVWIRRSPPGHDPGHTTSGRSSRPGIGAFPRSRKCAYRWQGSRSGDRSRGRTGPRFAGPCPIRPTSTSPIRSGAGGSECMRFLDEAHQQGADPRIEDVAIALGVSVATVRRDVAELRRTVSGLNTRGSR